MGHTQTNIEKCPKIMHWGKEIPFYFIWTNIQVWVYRQVKITIHLQGGFPFAQFVII